MRTNAHTFNAALRQLGGDCNEYDAYTVAWNDMLRSVHTTPGVSPTLSCWGPNITDARIITEDGRVVPYVRPSNMDEKVGIVKATDVHFKTAEGTLVSVQTLLEDPKTYAEYMGTTDFELGMPADQDILVRIQTGWIPMSSDESSVKYAVGHYSYQTRDSARPRNFLFTGTNQGIFAHADTPGINTLYAHTVHDDGAVHKHWFEATPSDNKVGDVADTKKFKTGDDGTADMPNTFGIRGMGDRNNVFMVLSIPNAPPSASRVGGAATLVQDDDDDDHPPVYRSMSAVTGVSRQADVTIASESLGTCEARELAIKRPDGELPILTIVCFNTVQAPQGAKEVIVAPMDLANAVRDMETIYSKCRVTCKLSHVAEMLRKWTPEDNKAVMSKLADDPPLWPPTPTEAKSTIVPNDQAMAAFA